MLNYATLYQRFKQTIYITLNYVLIQVIGYFKLLAMRVYNVNCPSLSQTKHMIDKQHKMFQALRGKLLGDVIIHVARKLSR